MSKRQKLDQLPKFASKFYPRELPTKVAAKKYTNDNHKPYYILNDKIEDTQNDRDAIKPRKAIAHWFVRDFRIHDNSGLSKANELAKKHNVPMVTFWVKCAEECESHYDSEFKKYYRSLSLQQLHEKLGKLNIELVTLVADKKKDIVPTIAKFLEAYDISHLFSNLEYEVDELRLAIKALDTLLDKNISYTPCHDTCLVKPGELKTKSKGTQFAVFTPWYRVWVDYTNKNYLSKKLFVFATPQKMEKSMGNMKEKADFDMGEVDKSKFNKYWPLIGEDGAREALDEYIQSDGIKEYDESRDALDIDSVSHLSAHISSGTISTRTILQELYNAKKLSKLDLAETSGISEWVRQVSWRDFYRHIICHWPYVCMFKPFHLELSDLQWEYNKDHYDRWCEGKTGFPIVDACMRCLKETGYLNNRGRLIVASFFAKDLLIDWRYGEQYFMSRLIDGDFASNNGGWGFAASTGVDPQPYFRIFNPWTQSERFDPEGRFIRKWVPELKFLKGKAIHEPYKGGKLDELAESGYPEPIVNHKECRERALERYKSAMTAGKEMLAEET